jgi:hypothetical protein
MKKKRGKYRSKPAKMSNAKIIAFLILTPIVTWYSKQNYNDPWRMRSSFYFEKNAIVLFEENNREKSNEFRLLINESSTQNIDIYGWKIRYRNWGCSVVSGDTSIIIADKNFEKNLNAATLCDILVSSAETNEAIAEERLFFRPKITIWFTDGNKVPIAKNVFIPKGNEKFRVKERLHKFQVTPLNKKK